jgi:hypothetical protein
MPTLIPTHEWDAIQQAADPLGGIGTGRCYDAGTPHDVSDRPVCLLGYAHHLGFIEVPAGTPDREITNFLCGTAEYHGVDALKVDTTLKPWLEENDNVRVPFLTAMQLLDFERADG